MVGVTFAPGYPDSLLRVARAAAVADRDGEVLGVALVRAPNNEHDPYAVEVHVVEPAAMVGHLPRPVAYRLAYELDTGTRWQAWVEKVRLAEDHRDRPGLDVGLSRQSPAPVREWVSGACATPGCEARYKADKWNKIRANDEGWYLMRDGSAWCPRHRPYFAPDLQ